MAISERTFQVISFFNQIEIIMDDSTNLSRRMRDLIDSFIWSTAAAISPIGIVYMAIGLKLSFLEANSYFIDNILKVLGLAIAPVSAMIISLNLKNRRTRKVTTNIALLHATIQPKYMKGVNGAESLSERML